MVLSIKLAQAVAAAKAAGRTKATAKDLAAEPRETLQAITKEILHEAEIEEPASPESDDMVPVRFPWSLYERWKALA